MSIATFESPQVATQQFFPWVLDDDADCRSHNVHPKAKPIAKPAQVTREASKPVAKMNLAAKMNTGALPARATEARIGQPVRLGAVMIKLLKSYGITDDEIAEGLATYAAKTGLATTGLAQAG